MTSQENAAITMLRRINAKLDSIIERLALADRKPVRNKAASERLRQAREIAEMTPTNARQTGSVELLRQDRAR